MTLNKDLLETSDVYREVAALDCFSDEIEQMEKDIQAHRQDVFEWVENGVKKGIRYERGFYPEEHISKEEFEAHLLEDAKRGFWGEPYEIVEF
jgi:hypothetical protein